MTGIELVLWIMLHIRLMPASVRPPAPPHVQPHWECDGGNPPHCRFVR